MAASLVMLVMANETTGGPFPGSGVHMTDVWSSDTVMMPSFFLKTALPRGTAMTPSQAMVARDWSRCALSTHCSKWKRLPFGGLFFSNLAFFVGAEASLTKATAPLPSQSSPCCEGWIVLPSVGPRAWSGRSCYLSPLNLLFSCGLLSQVRRPVSVALQGERCYMPPKKEKWW